MSEINLLPLTFASRLNNWQHDELMRFTALSYGNDFLSEHTESTITEATHFFLLRDDTTALVASAIVREKRITSISTHPSSPVGSRFSLGLDLLSRCYDSEKVSWGSVGIEYEKVSRLLAAAGMERVLDVDTIQLLVGHEDYSQPQKVRKFVVPQLINGRQQLIGGPLIINGPASQRTGYPQEVWAWLDRL